MSLVDLQISHDNLHIGAALHEIVCDDAGRPVDYRFLDVNPAFEGLMGLSREQVVGKTILEIIRDIEPSWIDRYGEVALTGIPARFEGHATATGRWYEVSAYSPGKNRLVALFSDITDRRRARESLRETERLLTQIETIANMGHWTWDVRKNTVAMSDGMLRIFGFAPDSVGSSPDRIIDRAIHPDDREKVRGMTEAVVSGRRSLGPLECRIVRPDGTIRTVVGESGDATFEARGPVTSLFGIVRDITDQKRIEHALRESETRFQNIFNLAAVTIWEEDYSEAKKAIDALRSSGVVDFRAYFDAHPDFVARVSALMRITDVNDAAVRMYEASSKRELLDAITKLFTPHTFLAMKEVLAGIAEKKTYIEVETIGRTLSGKEIHILVMIAIPDPESKLDKVLVSIIDVTRGKTAEAALRETEERFRHIVHSAPMMIFIVCDDRIVFMNETGLALLGASSPEEMIGKPVLEMVHPDSRNAIRKRIRRVVDERLPTSLMEQKYLRRDGSVLQVEAMAVPIPYRGRPAIQVFVRDLTRQKAAEKALRDSQDQLRQAQKMEAVGRLAGGIAHDFNNLLTVILGYNSLILRGLDEENPHRKEAVAIQGAAERASSLTQQLLAFSRRQILQPKIVDLNRVVAGTESILRRIIGEDIELVTRLANDLCAVKVDPAQMEQVIVNLAVNSRDAMPRGGTILIETANAEADEALMTECPSLGTGPCVLLKVTDTGTGMTEETKARAFEPFFTTKELGKGTGLGLSMVYGIVEQNHGHIAVRSAIGRGTTFSIYLPGVEGAVETAPGMMPAAGSGGQGTILLVEDEILVRDLARDILSREGYRVIEAGNGDEAVILLQQDPLSIDLLVADVVMPPMGGRGLAERILAVRPGIRILFMSGYADDAVARQEIGAGRAFIQKPFSPAALIRKVREVLGDDARGGP